MALDKDPRLKCVINSVFPYELKLISDQIEWKDGSLLQCRFDYGKMPGFSTVQERRKNYPMGYPLSRLLALFEYNMIY